MSKKPEAVPASEEVIPEDEKPEASSVKPAPASSEDNTGWQRGNSQIWTPEAGDAIQGIYDGAEPFTEGSLDTEVSKHFVVDAKDMRFSFVGGSIFDKAVSGAGITPGMEVRITYLGKKELAKEGRRVNLFDIKYRKAEK